MVLLALASLAKDDTLEAWPTHATLAAMANVHRVSVVNAVEDLEKGGTAQAPDRELERFRRVIRGRSVVHYRLLLPDDAAASAPVDVVARYTGDVVARYTGDVVARSNDVVPRYKRCSERLPPHPISIQETSLKGPHAQAPARAPTRAREGAPRGPLDDGARGRPAKDVATSPGQVAAGRYRQRCTELGQHPLARDVARVGAAAVRLHGAGVAADVIAAAVDRAADRNRPGAVEGIAGDIEREVGEGSRQQYDPAYQVMR